MKYFAIVLFAPSRTKKALKNELYPLVYLCNFNFGLVNYKILQRLVCILDIIKFTRRNTERCFYVKFCGWIIFNVAIVHLKKVLDQGNPFNQSDRMATSVWL